MDAGGDSTHHSAAGNVAMDRGERFRRAVQAKATAAGMASDEALARAAGISANTLRNWWHGKGLELGTLVAVADVLDESVFDLLSLWQGRTATQPSMTIAEAVAGLVAELHAWRTADCVRIAQLEATVKELVRAGPLAPESAGAIAPRARRQRAG